MKKTDALNVYGKISTLIEMPLDEVPTGSGTLRSLLYFAAEHTRLRWINGENLLTWFPDMGRAKEPIVDVDRAFLALVDRGPSAGSKRAAALAIVVCDQRVFPDAVRRYPRVLLCDSVAAFQEEIQKFPVRGTYPSRYRPEYCVPGSDVPTLSDLDFKCLIRALGVYCAENEFPTTDRIAAEMRYSSGRSKVRDRLSSLAERGFLSVLTRVRSVRHEEIRPGVFRHFPGRVVSRRWALTTEGLAAIDAVRKQKVVKAQKENVIRVGSFPLFFRTLVFRTLGGRP